MKLGIPREIGARERRVSVVPDQVKQFRAAKLEVLVEAGAGEGALFPDRAYQEAGATVVSGAAEVWGADAILKILPPLPHPALGKHEAELLREGSILVCMLSPFTNLDVVRTLVSRRVTSFSMDMVPRTTRAQRMDANSSMATASGYKAVLLAASHSPRFYPMFVTAAGTIPPSRVLVVGAGVAGLQAIATARRLGAVVEAYDIRPAAKEEAESLGAIFIGPTLTKEEAQDEQGYARPLSAEKQREGMAKLRERLKVADAVITTARVPGLKAPRLIPADAVAEMKAGAVIVDLAADMGGNCELTKADAEVDHHGVKILGPVRLEATIPTHASMMYSRNMTAFVLLMVKDGALNLDFKDDILAGSCVTHDGAVRHAATRERLEGAPAASAR